MKKTLLLAGLAMAGSASAERWNKQNNPHYFNIIMQNKITYSFAELSANYASAKLKDDRYAWSENYWRADRGGIANRWNDPMARPFENHLYTKEELKRMDIKQLEKLSPAELYDIAMGDYSYSLTKKVLRQYSVDDAWWEGICDGWSLAAINYAEPKPVVVRNRDGIRVPFGSSDVKGLLSMHEKGNNNAQYVRVGARCSAWGKVPGEAFPEDISEYNEDNGTNLTDLPMPTANEANDAECRDVNAGAFHLIITNMIGRNSQGFIADVDRFNDVWNQPVYAYESSQVGFLPLQPMDFNNGVATKVHMKLKMIYGDELEFKTEELVKEGVKGFVSKRPVTGTEAQTWGEKNYEYILELDNAGKIIGGEWISVTRPDLLWSKAKTPAFLDKKYDLKGLKYIYRPVDPRQ